MNANNVRSSNKIEELTTFGEAQVPNTPAEDSTTEEAALEKPRGHPSGTEFLQGHYPFSNKNYCRPQNKNAMDVHGTCS
jgi:hypothetical protein